MNYSNLDPQQVLDALDAVGLRGDGRVLQLNSYENRVFQVFLEDGSAVVAKFYRPGRWRDEQIVEEHAFAMALAAAEVPVVPPLVLQARAGVAGLRLLGTPATLACLDTLGGLLRYTVAQRCAGREPELEDPATLRQLGRFIGRLHAVGKQRPFEHRHHLNARIDGRRALALLIDGGFVPRHRTAGLARRLRTRLDRGRSRLRCRQPTGDAASAWRLPPRRCCVTRARSSKHMPMSRMRDNSNPGSSGIRSTRDYPSNSTASFT